MLRMALNDISQNCAVIFIDPKGEHARALYNLIPDKDRVTYFSYDHPSLTINPLRKKGYRLFDVVDEFGEILDIVIKQTSPANPPASENMKEILAHAISAIKEPDRNIDFLYEFLRYPEVRKNYLKRGALPAIGIISIRSAAGGKEPDEVMTAKRIAVRLNKFVNDDRFRRIVTGENQLDIADDRPKPPRHPCRCLRHGHGQAGLYHLPVFLRDEVLLRVSEAGEGTSADVLPGRMLDGYQ